MELPLFALHSVVYPGADLELRVFEDRYLAMMANVLPGEPFAIAAIRVGREVGGPSTPYEVGVSVVPVDHEVTDDGAIEVHVHAEGRVRLLAPVPGGPYARWQVEPFPEEGTASDEVMARAFGAATRFLREAGVSGEIPLDRDPVAMSYLLATLTPGLVPDRQELLEIPGPAERLASLTRRFRQEAGLLQALRGHRAR